MAEESVFLSIAHSQAFKRWDKAAINEVARVRVPGAILGEHREIVLADIKRQWATWFIESIGDPARYIACSAGYALIYGDVAREVKRRLPYATKEQHAELTSCVARIIHARVKRAADKKSRVVEDVATRRMLLDFSGNPPRCWICGAAFHDSAIDSFLDRGIYSISLPPIIDFLKPRGLSSADYRVEIDHLEPYHEGGERDENLALACGFCNRYKGGYGSIYDVSGRPIPAGVRLPFISSLPQLFWVIRSLAVIGVCEHEAGCGANKFNSHLTIAPISSSGAMNPTNMKVTCYEHDSLQENRFMKRKTAERLWSR